MWRRWGRPYNVLLVLNDDLWKTQKIRILKKWRKEIAGDIIILHMSTKNHNHMRYSSWDTKNEKMKISEKLKKILEIPSFYTIVQKIMIIGYTVPEIWHVTDVTVIFHSGLFVALLPSHPHLELSSFYTGVPKIMIRWCTVSEIWCRQTKKSDI